MLQLAQQAAGSGMPEWMAWILGPLGALAISIIANYLLIKRLDRSEAAKDKMADDLLKLYKGIPDEGSSED